MEFKKANNTSIQIKTKSSNFKIMLETGNDGYFSIKTVKEDDVTSLEIPGEYGVGGVHFVMLEENVEEYNGKPTVVSISDTTYLNVMVLSNKFELSTKAIDKMPDPDIIVAPFTSDSKLFSLVKKTNPGFLILIKDFLGFGDDEKVSSKIKSDFALASDSETKVKIEKSDLAGDEDIVTQVYIIN